MASVQRSGARARHPKRLSEGHYVVTYSCMCRAYGVRTGNINAATADRIFCNRHRRPVSVFAIVPAWWYTCANCHCVRDYGVAPLTAGTKASAHAIKHPGHNVAVYEGAERRETHRLAVANPDDLRTPPIGAQYALTLADPTDPPPF